MRTLEITIVSKSNPSTVRREISFVQDVPKEARENFELAVKLLNDGRTDESLALLQKAINTFPDYFDARLLLASELIKQRRFNDAITHLEQARRVNPKDDRVFQAFGMIMMQQQKFAVAARIFAEAARLNPRDPRYLILQGTALIDQAVRIDGATPAAADERNYSFNEAESVAEPMSRAGGSSCEVHCNSRGFYGRKAIGRALLTNRTIPAPIA
jgi:tetratricopeptide (TPR) repeat protein